MQKITESVPVLMYHIIDDNPPGDNVYALSTADFDAQMKYLSDTGFRAVSPNELVDNNVKPGPKVVITFDDGHISSYTHAFPILKKYGLTATFFITTGYIGTDDYVSWEFLSEMAGSGMTIGSHTVSHPFLTLIPESQAVFELVESKKILERNLKLVIDSFSNPHYFTNKKIQKIAFVTGYKTVCISKAGYYRIGSAKKVIERINISNGCRLSDFESIMRADKRFLLKINAVRAITSVVRPVVGIDLYEKIKKIILSIINKG